MCSERRQITGRPYQQLADLAVDGQIGGVVAAHLPGSRFIGHDHRTIGQRVRADGRDAQWRPPMGNMIGPPAESEYAVDPVGVETIRPSAL